MFITTTPRQKEFTPAEVSSAFRHVGQKPPHWLTNLDDEASCLLTDKDIPPRVRERLIEMRLK